MPRNRYLSQLFRNGVVSTPIFDTGHNALIINAVIPDRSAHYATRGNGVGGESRTRDLSKTGGRGWSLKAEVRNFKIAL